MYTGGEEEYWNEELTQSLDRYERMKKASSEWYFDVHELEGIFDYYFNQRKYKAAQEVLQLGNRFHPGSEVLRLKEAQIFIERGEANQALSIIHDVEPIDQNNEQLFLLKGSAYLILDQLETARDSYQKAIEISDEPEEWIFSISLAFQKLGEYEHAIHLVSLALEKSPDSEDMIWDLAVCYEQSGKDEKAIELYRKYLDYDPFSDAGWFNLGVLYNQNDRYEEALEAFEYVLAISPDFHAALFNKGNTLANNNMHQEAIQVYAEFLLENENHPQALCYIGDSYEKLNKYHLALQYYRKARAVDPAFSESWYGLSNLMFNQGYLYEAMYYIRKAMNLKKSQPDYLFLAAQVYAGLEFYEEAQNYLTELLKIDPEDEEARELLNQVEKKSNDRQE